MNSRSALIVSLGLALSATSYYPHQGNPVSFDPKDVKRPKPSPPKGLTKFNINGKEIWALNLKNAIRKSKK